MAMLRFDHATRQEREPFRKKLIPSPIQFQTVKWPIALLAENDYDETIHASVAELADAPDLGSGTKRCGGSTPLARNSIF
jgi:hypothetical protein